MDQTGKRRNRSIMRAARVHSNPYQCFLPITRSKRMTEDSGGERDSDGAGCSKCVRLRRDLSNPWDLVSQPACVSVFRSREIDWGCLTSAVIRTTYGYLIVHAGGGTIFLLCAAGGARMSMNSKVDVLRWIDVPSTSQALQDAHRAVNWRLGPPTRAKERDDWIMDQLQLKIVSHHVSVTFTRRG